MKTWKNWLVPTLFALSGVCALVPAVKRVMKGEPLDDVAIALLCLAITWFVLAYIFGQKSGGGSGPPSA